MDYIRGNTPRLQAERLNEGIFQMMLEGGPGTCYRVEASANLIDWSPLVFVLPQTGPIQVEDTDAALWPHRFYRPLILP